MKIRTAITAAILLSTTQGCALFNRVGVDELRHDGGVAGAVMDQRMFNSHGSSDVQLLRWTMVVALASRVGVASIQDGREADAFLSYLASATDELNYLAGHLYGQSAIGAPTNRAAAYTCDGLPPPAASAAVTTNGAPSPAASQAGSNDHVCGTYRANFEADLPQLEYKVVRLVLAGLPRAQAGRFASSLRSANVAAAAWDLLKLAAAAVDGLHRGAAVYRSSEEIMALAIAATGGRCANGDSATRLSGRSVVAASTCLGNSPDSLMRNPDRMRLAFDGPVSQDAFHALFQIMRTSCALLPVAADVTASKDAVTARRTECGNLNFDPQIRFPRTS